MQNHRYRDIILAANTSRPYEWVKCERVEQPFQFYFIWLSSIQTKYTNPQNLDQNFCSHQILMFHGTRAKIVKLNFIHYSPVQMGQRLLTFNNGNALFLSYCTKIKNIYTPFFSLIIYISILGIWGQIEFCCGGFGGKISSWGKPGTTVSSFSCFRFGSSDL